MAQLDKGLRQLRVPLQRHAHAKHGQGQAALFKLAQQAPHTGARTIFVDAFHAQVPRRVAGGVEHLGQKLLRAGVAVQDRVLAAFLVVQHELEVQREQEEHAEHGQERGGDRERPQAEAGDQQQVQEHIGQGGGRTWRR